MVSTDDAVTDVDRDLLTKTGTGGLLSKGYLSDEPFIGYLKPNENLRGLLWSHKSSPKTQGLQHSEVSVEGYRSITAITDTRVLVATGTSSGDQVIEVPLCTIEGIRTGSTGRLRKKGWMQVWSSEGFLTVFDRSGVDLAAVEQVLIDTVAEAKTTALSESINKAVSCEKGGDLHRAHHLFNKALWWQADILDWRDLYDVGISTPERDLNQDLARVGNRLDIDDCIQQGEQAEVDGQFITATEAYGKALEINQETLGWEPEYSINRLVARAELKEIAQTAQTLLDQADQASEPTETRNKYREVLDLLEVYTEQLFEVPFHCTDEICDICGRVDSTTLISFEGTNCDACSLCEVFDKSGYLWTQSDISELRDTLGPRVVELTSSVDNGCESPTRTELVAALNLVADKLGHLPSNAEFTHECPYGRAQVLSQFQGWEAALQAAGLDPQEVPVDAGGRNESKSTESDPGSKTSSKRQELIDAIKSVHSEIDRLPKTTDVQEKTDFTQHDFTEEFGDWESALAEAEIDIEQHLLDEIRVVTEDLGHEPSTLDINNHTPYWGSTYSDYFGSWEAALNQVDLSDVLSENEGDDAESENEGEDDSPTREDLLTELRRLNAEIDGLLKADHMVSKGEYSVHDYLSVFGSWDQALEAIGVNKDELLLDEVRRVWKEVGEEPTVGQMGSHGQHSPSMYYDRFDSWEAVLNAVDQPVVEDDDKDRIDESEPDVATEKTSREDSSSSPSNSDSESSRTNIPLDTGTPSRDGLLSEINRLADEVDGLILVSDMQERGIYAVHEYTDEFGSWDAALEAAGIDKKTQLLDEVGRVWEQLGRRPSTTDMSEHGRVSATTVTNYFDSWETACQATSQETDGFIFDNTSESEDSDDDHTAGDPTERDNVDLRRRDLVVALHAVTEELGYLPSADEVNEYCEYNHQRYREEFGGLFQAYQSAGLLPGDATWEDVYQSRSKESLPESGDDVDSEIDDALEKKMLLGDDL